VLLPAIKLLRERFPDAALDIVCERRNVAVLGLSGLQGSALVYDANPLRFLRRLRRPGYDVAIDTEQFHHFSPLFAAWSGAPVRIGFKINPRRNPLYTHLINYAPDGPEGEQFMRLLEPLGITQQPCRLDGLLKDMPPAAMSSASAAAFEGFARQGPYAALHMSATTMTKRWPLDRFAQLAQALGQATGMGILMVGGAREAGLADVLRRRIGSGSLRVLSLAGALTLAETATVMRTARLFVGGDSGLAHLAVALGVPTVVLFGPSDPMKWGAADGRHAVVSRRLPCSPCSIFGYQKPCRDVECMSGISVAEVLEACRRLLG
jgi:ADP-heptose:LPS heptosyltransferase